MLQVFTATGAEITGLAAPSLVLAAPTAPMAPVLAEGYAASTRRAGRRFTTVDGRLGLAQAYAAIGVAAAIGLIANLLA